MSYKERIGDFIEFVEMLVSHGIKARVALRIAHYYHD